MGVVGVGWGWLEVGRGLLGMVGAGGGGGVVGGGWGFTHRQIPEVGSLPSPFGEALATEIGDVGIMGCDGPPALDTPLEDGKEEWGAVGEEEMIRFAVLVFP